MRRGSEGGFDGGGGGVGLEMAVIGYFHRLTVLILGTLAEIVEAQDDDDDDDGRSGSLSGSGNGDGNAAAADRVRRKRRRRRRDEGEQGEEEETEMVEITSDDLTKMGLDVWSESDRAFVEELVDFYWGRKARVQGGGVECCGVRVL